MSDMELGALLVMKVVVWRKAFFNGNKARKASLVLIFNVLCSSIVLALLLSHADLNLNLNLNLI
jgi:hypothetical protein